MTNFESFKSSQDSEKKLSVIVTCYNYGSFLTRCLRSLILQTLDPSLYEIIVVDDCSSDSSEDVAKSFLDFHGKNQPFIKYIRNDINCGVASSSNIGIAASSGTYFVRVDADDYVNKNMLYMMSEYLDQNHEILCVSCDYIHVNDDEKKLRRFYAETDPISCGIMYRRQNLIELGTYNPDWRHREEEELRKRLGSRYVIEHLRMPFYRYRMHPNNKTKSISDMQRFKSLLTQVKPDE